MNEIRAYKGIHIRRTKFVSRLKRIIIFQVLWFPSWDPFIYYFSFNMYILACAVLQRKMGKKYSTIIETMKYARKLKRCDLMFYDVTRNLWQKKKIASLENTYFSLPGCCRLRLFLPKKSLIKKVLRDENESK